MPRFWPLALILALPPAAVGDQAPDSTDYQQTLQLLAGIGSEYREAFDDQGTVIREIDIDETKLLLTQLSNLIKRLPITREPGVDDTLNGLTTLIEERVPPLIISAYVEVFRRAIIRASGVHEEIVPLERPSLARGRDLFHENCAGCHGVGGAGDGADAIRLGLKPANFADPSFMRAETPRDAFNVIMLGRQKSGMPAWGESLSPQQVWDLVSYLWSLARQPASVLAGQQIYAARCAGCHGENGDPTRSRATDLERPTRSFAALLEGAELSDSDLFAAISNGVPHTAMPAFAPVLGEEERWAAVTFTRLLSLEGAPGAAAEPMEPDYVAEMGAVGRLLDSALDAHRRGDPSATTLATNAYFRFEPLEKPLSEIDAARVDGLERDFLAFRTALQNTATGDPGVLGGQLRSELAQAAELLRPTTAPPATQPEGAHRELAVIAALILVAAVSAIAVFVRRSVGPAGPPP